ncbi:MAG TPA: sugar transferase [Pseudonocardiaceae bacterium]|nr:sugar transferase [Pseudonocardiaceae bacterium]
MTTAATLPAPAPALTLARPARLPGAAVPLVVDIAALGAAVVAGGGFAWPVAGFVVTVLGVLAGRGLLRERICPRVSDQVPSLVGAVAAASFVLLPFLPSTDVLWLSVWSALLLVCGRLTVAVARRRGLLVRPVLLVGSGPVADRLAGILADHPEYGLRPMDRAVGVRQAIVCSPGDLSTVPAGLDVALVWPGGHALPRSGVDDLWGVPLVPLCRVSSVRPVVKRAMDVTIGGLLLVVLAPLLGLLMVGVLVTSGRPVLFGQRRITGAGRTAVVLKLRTLPAHADADTRWDVPVGATRLGAWLRRTHLDELPQLLNVVRGQMSLVGPRPERPYFAARFGDTVPHYAGRHRMPAGITGWAQVHGLHGDTSMVDRVRFDNQYVANWTPWLDLVVLCRTLVSPWQRGGSR